ncbi:2-hydroxychromene-2-carboxylate isomerase [Ramlibacter rhizophilus]|uniref:2-hydroxychromene-2-carboxylate isomerase n=1 Tax=Ramlibacter rhizophilus TaxID=1781167 RepID=A0A4Z0C199_9BURK|nr:2-hydroxychromene-2-carboxylate isomerase [Ramlibacter rhizophilus]TFZ04574.1 2-hydroxychromene-2-carboxylate isomerase [Ramlibacter rhizophilus]
MPRSLQYWISTASPWTWLGSARFAELVRQTAVAVDVLPMDLSTVFSATGGTPFPQRSRARQTYRQLELARWSRRLGVPITLEPRHYPVDRGPSSRLLIAAAAAGHDALSLSHYLLRAIWLDDQNIADWATLAQLADQAGLDGTSLVRRAQAPEVQAQFLDNTARAIDAQVFGSPTFIVDGERFWGQDRLDFLAERLAA